MQEYRKIIAVDTGDVLEKGGKTRVTRFITPPEMPECSPFLLMEVLELADPDEFGHGFPWRAYEGIECVTCLMPFDRRRHDAGPNDQPVWLSASNGEVREEVPALKGPTIGMQVWAWLPKDANASEISCPAAVTLPSCQVAQDVRVDVIAGAFGETEGALPTTWSDLTMLDVYLAPHAAFTFDQFASDNLLVYVLEGEGYFEAPKDELFPEGRMLVMGQGEKLEAAATHRGLRFILLHAPGHGTAILDTAAVRETNENWVSIARSERSRR